MPQFKQTLLSLQSQEPQHTGRALAIGKFDGAHLGHQHVLRLLVELARRQQLDASVLTFSPSPREFFGDEPVNQPLFTSSQKRRALTELGLSCLITQTFDEHFSRLTPREFYQNFLLDQSRMKALVVGPNFRFGHERHGNVEILEQWSREDGWDLKIAEPVAMGGVAHSSTVIRKDILERGDMESAQRLLGRPYLLEGVIESGDEIGRQIGFPTLNLKPDSQLTPAKGVYSAQLWIGEAPGDQSQPLVLCKPRSLHPAVVNIGVRPTLEKNDPSLRIESHALCSCLSGQHYGHPMGIYFLHRLRDEKKFPDLDALKSAIKNDMVHARNLGFSESCES